MIMPADCSVQQIHSIAAAEHVSPPVGGPAEGGEGGLPAGGQGVHRGHQESGGGRKQALAGASSEYCENIHEIQLKTSANN